MKENVDEKYLIIDKVFHSIAEEKADLEKDLIRLHNRPDSFHTQVNDIKNCLSKIVQLDLIFNAYLNYVPEEYSQEKRNTGK